MDQKRIAILMKKAENEKLEIPYDVTEFLAASFTDDIRMMEGAMVKILALSSLTNTDINKNLSKTVIKDILGDKAFKKITMKDICKKVSKETGISESKVYSKSRQVDIVFSRHISMYLCRQLTKNSLTHIGIGASINHNISIGKNVVIGGGSFINKNCKSNSIYFGVPGKFINKRNIEDSYL